MYASAPFRAPLKTPGVYRQPDAQPARLAAQRMDLCAFVGVAPRGPAYVPVVDEQHPAGYRQVTDGRAYVRSQPVAVNSFDEYRRIFGAFEGPGLLPFALASFFEQGGERAYALRIVPSLPPSRSSDPADLPAFLRGAASGLVPKLFTQPLRFYARNLGAWGDGLSIQLSLSARTLGVRVGAANSLWVDEPNAPVVNQLLRLRASDGSLLLRFCRGLNAVQDSAAPRTRWQLQLDGPLAISPVGVELIEAQISLRDGAGNCERFEHLSLQPEHPQSLANVLCNQSQLIWPGYQWAASELMPSSPLVELLVGHSEPFSGGLDAYEQLTPADFFDPFWSPAEELPGAGITALAGLNDAAHLVVPDLYVPAQWAGETQAIETRIDEAGAEFARCVNSSQTLNAAIAPPTRLTGLILDPRRSGDLQAIADLQNQLVAFCETSQNLIALLDVPPGLSQGQAERWRAQFDSSWAAAYHTWLIASRRVFSQQAQRLDTLRPIPPSAVAAGIIARKELQLGIQYGPANERAREIVNLAEQYPQSRIEAFFPLGMNAFVRQSDGIHLLSARTLSSDKHWRQLSVRRLILMLRRTLLQETQWAVFEPNGPKLWSDLRHAIENLLRGLFRAGAFAGASEAESFFVRIHSDAQRYARGELLVEIGVAPAEPIEFILIQLRRSGDGTLILEH